MADSKIIRKEEFKNLRETFRMACKKVVLCHGVYDLLHYGHIEHLQEAKAQGDILVVSVTGTKYVNKGPGRPYFNDKQRMSFLASLEIVDYVLLSESVTVHEIVKYVQPDIYVKGQEYANAENDITGNIESEQSVVEKYGGEIYFTQGEVFSSTKLLNNFFDALPEGIIDVSHGLKEKYGSDLMLKLKRMVDGFTQKKILVVGDIIFDEYVFCKLQGLTAKDGVLSTRYDFEERYAGGSLAIARHLANFSDNVTLCAMMGTEKHLLDFIKVNLPKVKLDIIEDESFVTPVKRRFLKQHPQRQEYDKLFSVNRLLDDVKIKDISYKCFHEKLEALLPKYDMVIVCDYGHGLIQEKTINILENKSNYLAVNCQTNSSNYGMNLITKYKKADVFVVDDRELRLAFGQVALDRDFLLNKLKKMLHADYGWVTIGADGAVGISGDTNSSQIPAVTLHVKDTVGAGDAFYSLAVLCAEAKMDVDCATLISNTAGAIKTNLVGNSKPIEKVDLLKFLNTILNV